jgi:hypothetical protein
VKTEFPQFLSCSSVVSATDAGTGTRVTQFLSDLVPGMFEEEDLPQCSILSPLFKNASH